MRKVCTRCRVERDLKLFITDKVERKQCKGCREAGAAKFKRAYKRNPGKIMKQIVARRKALPVEVQRAVRRRARALYFKRNPQKRREKNRNYRSRNMGKMLAHQRARELRLAQAMPQWADTAKIESVYTRAAKLRAEGHDVHVEHVVPLKGDNVCGLHVHTNLKIRSASFNLKKSNKH